MHHADEGDIWKFLKSMFNGAKLGDATVARAPPLLCHPRNL